MIRLIRNKLRVRLPALCPNARSAKPRKKVSDTSETVPRQSNFAPTDAQRAHPPPPGNAPTGTPGEPLRSSSHSLRDLRFRISHEHTVSGPPQRLARRPRSTPYDTTGFGRDDDGHSRIRPESAKREPIRRSGDQSGTGADQSGNDSGPNTTKGSIRVRIEPSCWWAKGDLNPHVLTDTGT